MIARRHARARGAARHLGRRRHGQRRDGPRGALVAAAQRRVRLRDRDRFAGAAGDQHAGQRRRRCARSRARAAAGPRSCSDMAGLRGGDRAHRRGAEQPVRARLHVAARDRRPVPQHPRARDAARATRSARGTATSASPSRRATDAGRLLRSFLLFCLSHGPRNHHFGRLHDRDRIVAAAQSQGANGVGGDHRGERLIADLSRTCASSPSTRTSSTNPCSRLRALRLADRFVGRGRAAARCRGPAAARASRRSISASAIR